MRLVPMGTGPFGVPTFRALYATDHQIVAVVTSPPRGRGRRPSAPSQVRQLAEEQGTPIFDPESINTDEATFSVASQHVDGNLYLAAMECWTCHGDGSSDPVPPMDASGNTLFSAQGVGAHQIHVVGVPGQFAPVACAECHDTYLADDAPGH